MECSVTSSEKSITRCDKPGSASEHASRVKDARGRSVTQVDPVTLHVWHRYDTLDEDTLHNIVEDLEPGTAKLRRRMIIIVPSAIVLLVLGVATLYYFGDQSLRKDLVATLMNPAIMVPSVFGCVVVPWITARQARLKRVWFAMLKHRRCPHCGYDLRLLPVDPADGATVCPECGCAWLIDEAAITEGLAAAVAHSGSPRSQRISIVAVLLLLVATALAGLFAAGMFG